MSNKAFWIGDKQYIVSETTKEEKVALKESHPLLYGQYFPEVKESVIEPVKECVIYDEIEVTESQESDEIAEPKPTKKSKATNETND